ncbi:MAG: LCP family protein, partial [bacterium]|nr:LCP family protein [bacterium]
MTNKKVRTNSQHNHMCFILNMIIISFWFLSLGVFSYALFQVNIIPNKYLVIGYGVILLSTCIFLYMMFQSSKKIIKCFAYIIVVFSSLLFIYSTTYLNNTYHFFQSTQTKEHNTLTYSVVVLEVNSYNEITSLENKTISYLDDEYREALKQGLSSQITYKESLASEFGILPDQLLNSEVDAICLEESYLALITEEIEEFSVLTKVIHTFEVKEKQNISSENSEIPIPIIQEPFILYISGIDQYGSVNSARGRSDVNQLVIVNPKTNHILLVNTPRDYYVPLADTGGKKDKLTHAGIYGINKSIKTLEKLYDIDINHYLRVNFNTL